MRGIDLKIAQIRQGRKQLELALQTKIQATRLSKIENGWEQPRPDDLSAICAELKSYQSANNAEGSGE